MLNSYHPGYRWSDKIVQGIRETLQKSDSKIHLFVEYMDSKRIHSQATTSRLAELMQEKYNAVKIDAVIVADDNAFSFFKRYRDMLFPSIPAIFCGANDLQQSDLDGLNNITGIVEAADSVRTLETALQLLPSTSHIVVVTDRTLTGLNVSREIKRQSTAFTGRTTFSFWDNISMEQLLNNLRELKEGTIVLYAFFFRDSDGIFYEYDDSARRITEASPVPVFGLWEFTLGYGIVGGMLVSGYEQGRVAGEMALDLIGGIDVNSIPLQSKSPNRFAFDFKALSTFNISTLQLPPESLVINETVSLYKKYKGILWSFTLAFIALIILTIFLIISIGRQRKTEARLRASKLFITGITNNVPGAVFQLTVTGEGRFAFNYASEKMGAIFDLKLQDPQIFDFFVSNIHDEDRDSFWASADYAIKNLMPLEYEGRYCKLSGEIIKFTVQAAPRVEKGQTVFDGVIIDSTELTNTKEKLQQSEKRLAEIINFLPDPTFVIDPGGKVLTWNRAMEDLTGIDAETILGKGDYEYALPFYGKRRPVMIDLVASWNEEIANRYKDIIKIGDQFISESAEPHQLLGNRYFRIVASPLYDKYGNVAGAIETLHDITKRRKAEEDAEKLYNETRANLAFIKALLSAIPIPVYFKGTDCRFIDCNQAYKDLQGFDAIKGKTVFDLYPKDKAEFYHEKDLELFKTEGLQHFESVVLDRDQKKREVLFAKSVFHDHTGKIAGIVGTFMDISDLKHALRIQEKLKTQLRQSQKMEALGTLAGGVAHDFNNILSAVLGYSELGMIELSHSNEPLYSKFKAIHQAGSRAKDLVTQILTFSRMQEQIKLPIQLVPLIKEVLKLLKSSFPADIQINVQLNTEKSVLADSTQIHQVLMNLCTNAYHAMQKNGGVLSVTVDETKVLEIKEQSDLKLSAGEYVRLIISDTGVGINPSIINKIFDPYFTTKMKGKGTGLGLAVVHGIVKQHKGEIVVTSQPDTGTTCTLYLPVCNDDSYQLNSVTESLPGGYEHVLLIDDEQELIQVGTEMLTSLGYKVTGIVGSAEALKLFTRNPNQYDIILSDFDMPGMTGDQLARRMLSIRADIPILIYSGFPERLTEEQARRIGIRQLLIKPLSMTTLSQTVRDVLDNRIPAYDLYNS